MYIHIYYLSRPIKDFVFYFKQSYLIVFLYVILNELFMMLEECCSFSPFNFAILQNDFAPKMVHNTLFSGAKYI